MPVSIVGKWYTAKHSYQLYKNNIQIGSSTVTRFTTADFVQYFNDGSGIVSTNASPSPNLGIFKYTLKGSILMQFNPGDNAGVPETIILLQNNLSLHYVLIFADANDPTAVDKEVDDYAFTR